MTDQRPHTPPVRSSNRYASFKDFKREITVRPQKDEPEAERTTYFNMNITASKKGESMDEQSLNEAALNEQFFIDMIFKPNEQGLRLRPEETQLLLAYIGEILKEVEIEEKLMEEEKKTAQQNG